MSLTAGPRAPRYSRERYAWRISEVGGAFGDLGTFLPHVIAAITVVGMSPSGVLVSFGLFYLAAGALYGIPMPVQPMKAASAAVLVEAMAPAEVAGAGLVIGAFFLLAGASGFSTQLTRKVPASVSTNGTPERREGIPPPPRNGPRCHGRLQP